MLNLILLIFLIVYQVNTYPSSNIATLKNTYNRNRGSRLSNSWKDLLTIPELVQVDPRLSELRQILDKTELGYKLEQSRNITVLLPSNAAVRSYLKPLSTFMNYDDIMAIMKGHVIPNSFKVSELLPDESVVETTMSGTSVEFEASTYGSGLIKDPRSKQILARILAEIETLNGIIYVIDRMLLDDDTKHKLNAYSSQVENRFKKNNFSVPSMQDYILKANQQYRQF